MIPIQKDGKSSLLMPTYSKNSKLIVKETLREQNSPQVKTEELEDKYRMTPLI